MQTLSETQMLAAIDAGECFEATLDDHSLTLKIEEYVPYICTAIHAGQRLRDELQANCLLSYHERQHEEDLFTDQLITSFPITLCVNDSRYEYDVNRAPDQAIYQAAWGKQVWAEPISAEQKRTSLAKHHRYFRILKAILSHLELRFGGCLLMDVHSYNWQSRDYPVAPVFNIGTARINTKRGKSILQQLEATLADIELPNIATTVQRDVVFMGNGYHSYFINRNFGNTYAIPLEIKKIFMDEYTGEAFPLVLDAIHQGLYLAVLAAASAFNDKFKRAKLSPSQLLPTHTDRGLIAVDKALHKLTQNFATLSYVNPTNLSQEKRRFLSRRHYDPQFTYNQLRIDPYEFKEQLYSLPVADIQDPTVRALYRDVINGYATKAEMLSKVGTPEFLYNSMRYYGEPSANDIANAEFFLHAAELPGFVDEPEDINAEQAKKMFQLAAAEMKLDCKVSISSKIVAKAMVDNNRKTVLINRDAMLTQTNVNALIHHEIGVHLVTTLNANQQPLKVFKLGLPGNTYTQEGIAILAEYLSGNLNMTRLRMLSLRVLAVDMMVKGFNFRQVFNRLTTDYGLSDDQAFTKTMRVFRGGGFTKDYLYLRGFRDVLSLYKERDITSLLVGKTGLDYIDTLSSLIERGIINPPKYEVPAIAAVQPKSNAIIDYLVSSIK
ncbi:hypothetical protein SIN8267_00138 [Sinobacterium norvegicum]|uniref:Flavohemoglobin expression-modulating QEGLA motif protein n=1 Tax=Sinobacterium norvegicum TaxID=1641715 RepID=A0ABM9A9Y4_9GAMM|nr:flavohemoglobin expression-modulating QEGLA motif protein [Sinobacterium norvegicum]CAH0990055.1 hypothetical protein SIN8267_00138 [Sinobacterium norvegicum]